MTLKTKDIEKSLTRKGFSVYTNDHKYFVFTDDDRKTEIRTKISHSHNEIGDDLISKMSRQLQIDKKIFADFIECIKSETDYVQELKNKNILE